MQDIIKEIKDIQGSCLSANLLLYFRPDIIERIVDERRMSRQESLSQSIDILLKDCANILKGVNRLQTILYINLFNCDSLIIDLKAFENRIVAVRNKVRLSLTLFGDSLEWLEEAAFRELPAILSYYQEEKIERKIEKLRATLEVRRYCPEYTGYIAKQTGTQADSSGKATKESSPPMSKSRMVATSETEIPSDLIDLNKVTDIFACSRTHIKRLIKQGELTSYRKPHQKKHCISQKEAEGRLQAKLKHT